jgi:hypothetical protein
VPAAAAQAQDKDTFCDGFAEGWKTAKGEYSIVPICPIPPITPIGSTPYREGIKAGMRAAQPAPNSSCEPGAGQWLCLLGESMERRDAERRLQLAAEREAQRLEQLRQVQRAADSSRAAEQRANDRRQTAEAQRFDSVRMALYADRVIPVVQHLSDSLSLDLFNKSRLAFVDDATTTATALYRVNPLASTQAIRDQLVPIAMRYGQTVDQWRQRFDGVVNGFGDSARIPISERKALFGAAWKTYFADSTVRVLDGSDAVRTRVDTTLRRTACEVLKATRALSRRISCPPVSKQPKGSEIVRAAATSSTTDRTPMTRR